MITFKQFLESEEADYEWQLALMAEYGFKSEVAKWAVKWMRALVTIQDLPGDVWHTIVTAVPGNDDSRGDFLTWIEEQLAQAIQKHTETE